MLRISDFWHAESSEFYEARGDVGAMPREGLPLVPLSEGEARGDAGAKPDRFRSSRPDPGRFPPLRGGARRAGESISRFASLRGTKQSTLVVRSAALRHREARSDPGMKFQDRVQVGNLSIDFLPGLLRRASSQ